MNVKDIAEVLIELTTVVVKQRNEIDRYKDRIEELTERCNAFYAKLQEKESEQHLDVGMSYEELENELLATKELHEAAQKEVKNLGDILQEKDATITELRKELYDLKAKESTEGD